MESKSITKSKIAKMYGWSLVLLRKNIVMNKDLWQELKENYYNPYQKVLTPLHVEIIFKHLGRPES